MVVSARASEGVIEWLDAVDLEPPASVARARRSTVCSRFGFRIPPGFCLTTDAFVAHVGDLPGGDTSARTRRPFSMRRPGRARRRDGARAAGRRRSPTRSRRPARRGSLRACGTPCRDQASVGSVWPFVRRPSPRTARARRSPACTTRSSACTADEVAGRRSSAAGPRCGASGRSPIGRGADSRSTAGRWPSWSRHSSRPRPRPSPSPVIRSRGRTDQVLINAVPGLGEAMVSGTVTPDTIVVDKAARAVVEFTPGEYRGGGRPRRRPSSTRSSTSASSVETGVRRAGRHRGGARRGWLVSAPGPTDHDALRSPP